MTDEPNSGPGMARAVLLILALVVVAGLAWMLVGRADQPEEAAYEAGAVDRSGGELIVSDSAAAGVPVDLPETEMTNAPDETAPAGEQ